jgi:hypothetical protein
VLRHHADAVEADLARYYGIDIRDRFGGTLTLRRLAVLLRYLPHDAALYRLDPDLQFVSWTRTDHLLDDIRRQLAAFAGDKDPKPSAGRFPGLGSMPVSPERQKRLQAARRRARERRRRVAAGEIT